MFNNIDLSKAFVHIETKHLEQCYLFKDKLVVCSKNGDIIKVINVPKDKFASDAKVEFYAMYPAKEGHVNVIVSSIWTHQWADWQFKFYTDTLELSEEYHLWK